MIKYQTRSWDDTIVQVEIEKETDKSVWVKGQRQAKISDTSNFHDSWEQAHAYLVGRGQRDVDRATNRLDFLTQKLAAVKMMVKP